MWSTSSARDRARACVVAVVALIGAAHAGCAGGYAYRVDGVHDAVTQGDLGAAEGELTARLAASAHEPTHAALLRLELAAVRLRADEPGEAALALSEADGRLEVIDIGQDEGAELLSWVVSDAAAPYRTPPYEKLMVNVLGMAARLAADDVQGALVEARRLEVMRRFFADQGADPGGVMAAGELLAAYAHRRAGRDAEARLFASRAVARGPAGGMAAAWAEPAPSCVAAEQAPLGELLVVVARGRAPRKVALTVPSADAMQMAAAGGVGLRTAGQDDVTIVGLAPASSGQGGAPIEVAPAFAVDGATAEGALLADLAATARRTYEQAAPAIARKALTRASSRALVKGPKQQGQPALLASLRHVTGSLMESADTPDTRHWSLLPARLYALRAEVAPGTHVVTVTVGGDVRELEVDVGRDGHGFALLVVD